MCNTSKTLLSTLSSLALLSLLSACMTAPVVAPAAQDPVEASLDRLLAKKASQKPAGPETAAPRPKYGDLVSVSFLGDANTLLADAVKGRGVAWTFKVSGPQPRLPIYVQVNAKDSSFNAFLDDVAQQLGQRADIVMNGTAIELRYRVQN